MAILVDLPSEQAAGLNVYDVRIAEIHQLGLRRKKVARVLGIVILLASVAPFAFASPVPEIDGSSAASAIGLLVGVSLVLRSRKRRH